MQPYVTPAAGRTPVSNMIVDREDYKLSVTLTEFRTGEYQLCVDRFMQDSGWNNTQLFITETELNQIRRILNATE
jgi:hypothetical protein